MQVGAPTRPGDNEETLLVFESSCCLYCQR